MQYIVKLLRSSCCDLLSLLVHVLKYFSQPELMQCDLRVDAFDVVQHITH